MGPNEKVARDTLRITQGDFIKFHESRFNPLVLKSGRKDTQTNRLSHYYLFLLRFLI